MTGDQPDPVYTGGSPASVASAVQSIAAPAGWSSFTPSGKVDDLAVLVRPGATVTVTNDGTGTSAVLPAAYLIQAANDGGYDNPVAVTDGTRSAAVPRSSVYYQANAKLSAGGFALYPMGSPIPRADLAAAGLLDASGNPTFVLVLVPSGTGHVSIDSVAFG